MISDIDLLGVVISLFLVSIFSYVCGYYDGKRRQSGKEPREARDIAFSHLVYNALCRLEREGLIREVCVPAEELLEEWEKYEQEQEKEEEVSE